MKQCSMNIVHFTNCLTVKVINFLNSKMFKSILILSVFAFLVIDGRSVSKTDRVVNQVMKTLKEHNENFKNFALVWPRTEFQDPSRETNLNLMHMRWVLDEQSIAEFNDGQVITFDVLSNWFAAKGTFRAIQWRPSKFYEGEINSRLQERLRLTVTVLFDPSDDQKVSFKVSQKDPVEFKKSVNFIKCPKNQEKDCAKVADDVFAYLSKKFPQFLTKRVDIILNQSAEDIVKRI